MKVYIDSDYKCHVKNDGTMREIETNFFDNKCETFIEGYRYVPAGETWVREDGEKFSGIMVVPWINYTELALAQAEYEHNLLLQYEATLTEIETALEEEV